MTRGRCAVALVALAFGTAGAQTWHSVEVSRPLRDSGQLRVHAVYAGGKLDIRAATEPVLFGMQLRYSGVGGHPVHTYDSTNRTLTVGVSGETIEFAHHVDNSAGQMNLELSQHVPINLDVDLGAATADLDLGGLRLTETRVHSGAAQVTLAFSTPNVARMSVFEIDVGAAELDATGLANANASSIRVNAGVGALDLTLDGNWTQDVSLDVTADLGKVAVRVPSDVGIQVEAQKVVAGFEHPDLVKRGEYYVSSNWDTARYKLRVRANTTLGDIDIERTVH